MESKHALKTLILALAAASAGNSSADVPSKIVLSLEHPTFEGLHYDRVYRLIDQFRTVTYGEPIQILANLEKNGIDLCVFDEFVVTVDLAVCDASPNRESPL